MFSVFDDLKHGRFCKLIPRLVFIYSTPSVQMLKATILLLKIVEFNEKIKSQIQRAEWCVNFFNPKGR